MVLIPIEDLRESCRAHSRANRRDSVPDQTVQRVIRGATSGRNEDGTKMRGRAEGGGLRVHRREEEDDDGEGREELEEEEGEIAKGGGDIFI